MSNSTTQTTQAQIAMNYIWWGAGAALVVLGGLVAKQAWWATIPLILCGLAVFPVIFSRILERLNISDKINARMPIVMLVLLGSTYLVFAQINNTEVLAKAQFEQTQREQREKAEAARLEQQAMAKQKAQTEFNDNSEQILAALKKSISSKDVPAGQVIVSKYTGNVADMRFIALSAEFSNMKSEVEREKAIADLLNQAKTLKADQYDAGIQIYQKLAALDPRNKQYQVKVERFTKLQKEAVEREQKAKAEAAAKAARQKKMEEQFSAWDGAHRNFERLIKAAMNDPDSYEHIETRYRDMGDRIRVSCKFRGRNGFGGMVVNTKIADFDIDGNFIREIQ